MATPLIKRLRDNAIATFVWLAPLDPNTAHPVIQPLDRPNVDGFSFRKLAKKAEPFRVRCMRNFGTFGAARGASQFLRTNLIGELCLIQTRDGTQYTRMMCLEVHEDSVNEVIATSGGLQTTVDDAILPLGGAASGAQGTARFELIFVHA